MSAKFKINLKYFLGKEEENGRHLIVLSSKFIRVVDTKRRPRDIGQS